MGDEGVMPPHESSRSFDGWGYSGRVESRADDLRQLSAAERIASHSKKQVCCQPGVKCAFPVEGCVWGSDTERSIADVAPKPVCIPYEHTSTHDLSVEMQYPPRHTPH